MTQNPKVAVFMITYNHAAYIAQAIESVMEQECGFLFKLFIGEDCSTDETASICRSYKERFPDKIELYSQEKNIGLFANERLIYQACFNSGADYIASLEGDDYWIDKKKLQKQVDFLDANPDFSASYTNTWIVEKGKPKLPAKKFIWDVAQTAQLLEHDDFQGDNLPLSPGHTSTFVFRNHYFKDFPDWFYQVKVGDFLSFIILSKFGKAKFFNEFTSVYRIHESGISSQNFDFIAHTKERIFMYNKIDTYLEGRFAEQIAEKKAKHRFALLKFAYKRRKLGLSMNLFFLLLFTNPGILLKKGKSA